MPTPDINLAAGGKPTEVHIDQVNQWMRSSPWYQDLLKSFGQDPTNVHLNDSQKKQIVRAAQAQGVVVDEGQMEVDPSGNFNPKGHKLRNTLIVAGLAGATIATLGAAGAFTGPAALGLGAVEGGTAGISAGTVAALGTGAMAAVPVAAGIGGTAAALGGTAALTGGTTAATGGTTAAVAGGAKTIAGLSTSELARYGLGTAGNLVNGYLQNRAASKAQDQQQKYLDEALAYAKEQDAYGRKYKEGRDAVEATRYSDYTGRIAPYVATGASANDRMANLLGLPSAPSRASAPSAPPAAAPVNAAPVLMRAPDGSTQPVNPQDVAHYQAKGATVVSQGAV